MTPSKIQGYGNRLCHRTNHQTSHNFRCTTHTSVDRTVQEELQSIYDNQAWDLQELPIGRRVIGCKWVFSEKYNANNSIKRFKACLVAKGFNQTEGVDYSETFAPVVRISSIRTLIAWVTRNDFKSHQMDVKMAFLNGDLDEDVYMKHPPGFDDNCGRVCKLCKSLYRLK